MGSKKNAVNKAEKHLNKASKLYDFSRNKVYSNKTRKKYRKGAEKNINKAKKIISKYSDIKLSDIDKFYNVTKGYTHWEKYGRYFQ